LIIGLECLTIFKQNTIKLILDYFKFE